MKYSYDGELILEAVEFAMISSGGAGKRLGLAYEGMFGKGLNLVCWDFICANLPEDLKPEARYLKKLFGEVKNKVRKKEQECTTQRQRDLLDIYGSDVYEISKLKGRAKIGLEYLLNISYEINSAKARKGEEENQRLKRLSQNSLLNTLKVDESDLGL